MNTPWKDVYDRAGPFATVLADVSLASENGLQAVEALAQSVGQDLDGLGASPQVVEAVRERIADPVHASSPRSRYVVANADGVLVDEVLPVASETPVVEWEALPDPGPLLAHEAELAPFVLVQVDHEGGEVSVVGAHSTSAAETESAGETSPDIHKSRGGGLAHMRWQRSTEKIWRDNAREVADLAASRVSEGWRLVVVAGSVEARREVVESLQGGHAQVVELDRSGRASDGGAEELRDDVERAVRERLQERTEQLRGEIAEQVGREVAAVGVDAVLGDLGQGRVATLALDPAAVSRHTIEPARYPGLDLGAFEDGSVRADLALMAGASRTDAAVRILEGEALQGHAVVALPRWSDAA